MHVCVNSILDMYATMPTSKNARLEIQHTLKDQHQYLDNLITELTIDAYTTSTT